MNIDSKVKKSKATKTIALAVLFLFIITVVQVSSQSEKVKYSDLEKKELNDDEASQDLLREYYGKLLGYVDKQTTFNTIATQENIAVLNVTIDGKDKRILTRLRTGILFPGRDLSENLVVLGNISLKGILFSDVDSVFGTRRFFGVESTTLRFVDEGFSRLVNGEARVSINPMLRDLIAGYNVFLSAEGLTKGIYIAEKTNSYFVVKSVNPGSNVAFSWMLRGLRTGFNEGYLISQYAKEKGIWIKAEINFEDGITSVKINGFDKILALINETTGNIEQNNNSNNNNQNNELNNNSTEINNNSIENNELNGNQGINLVTGNLIDEFGLETDLGAILGDATPLPTITDENSGTNESSLTVSTQEDNITVNDTIDSIVIDVAGNATSNETKEISVLEFTLYSIDENFIVSQVADVTGLSLEQVRKLINFVYLEPQNFEDEVIEPQVANLDWIEKINGSVILRLG